MTFTPYYRMVMERDFYPGGEPYWTVKCNRCGDYHDYESEDEAAQAYDNHVCWEDDDDLPHGREGGRA